MKSEQSRSKSSTFIALVSQMQTSQLIASLKCLSDPLTFFYVLTRLEIHIFPFILLSLCCEETSLFISNIKINFFTDRANYCGRG